MAAIETELTDLRVHARASLDIVRETFARASILVIHDEFRRLYDYQSQLIYEACGRGLLVDAQHLPDRVIRQMEKRATDLLNAGHIYHPWGRRPWLLTHTWTGDEKTLYTGGDKRAVKLSKEGLRCAYLVEPLGPGVHMRLTEFAISSARVAGDSASKFALLPQPVVTIEKVQDTGEIGSFVTGPRDLVSPDTVRSARAPVLTVLLLMNTRGLAHDSKAAPHLKNSRRIRKKLPPLPGYTRIMTQDYVRAILSPERGTRKSPVPHLRRGHVRHLSDGRELWVRDALVNTKSEDGLSLAEARKGYRVT